MNSGQQSAFSDQPKGKTSPCCMLSADGDGFSLTKRLSSNILKYQKRLFDSYILSPYPSPPKVGRGEGEGEISNIFGS